MTHVSRFASGIEARLASVSSVPGSTQLARTPEGRRPAANERVQVAIADLTAAYGPALRPGFSAVWAPMVTMQPPSASPQLRQGGQDRLDGRSKAAGDLGLEVGPAQRVERRAGEAAGEADERVEPAEGGDRVGDHRLGAGRHRECRRGSTSRRAGRPADRGGSRRPPASPRRRTRRARRRRRHRRRP